MTTNTTGFYGNFNETALSITSLIGIIVGLLLNVWQTLLMKNIKLESECCKSCLIELSEND